MKLGIDFGTTNCTVGHLRKEGGRAIQPLIPSIIAWQNGDLRFGAEAQEILRSNRTDVYAIRDLKLMLGGDQNLVFGQTVVSPEDVAASLLEYLVGVGAAGETVSEAVIGTPVKISLENRKSLRRAAHRAGIPTVRFVYEPTAALIGAQRFSPPDRGGLVLVVDWGGGTLDIAVIRTDGERFEELTVGGDVADLGGTKIDEQICRTILDKNQDLRDVVSRIPSGRDRLKDEIELMKLEILESFEGEQGTPERHAPLWLEKGIIELERPLVFAVLRQFADRAAKVIQAKLEAGGIKGSQITSILFAGGVCRSPDVRNRILQGFPNARALMTVKGSDEPLQLQELTGAGCVEITKRNLYTEMSKGIGVRQSDDSVCILLPTGLALKVNTFRKADFLVTDPNCSEAVLDIGLVRGDHESVSMTGVGVEQFETLGQMYVPAAKYNANDRQPVLDYVELRIGIDQDLAVTASASSRMTQRTVTSHFTGVPLILQFQA